jgi:DNA replication licensing factor MCM6
LQTYIKCCRALKPQFTKEAATILKNEYKMLRKSDGKQSTSYRYTVRQLESLIRLSEAMARVHADVKIRTSYVREACRLLKTSNINIIKNDFEFEDNQAAINTERKEIKAQRLFNGEEDNDLFVSKLQKLTSLRRWKLERSRE